jgi:hypothetical protein
VHLNDFDFIYIYIILNSSTSNSMNNILQLNFINVCIQQWNKILLDVLCKKYQIMEKNEASN